MSSIVLLESAANATRRIVHLHYLRMPKDIPSDVSKAVDLFREDVRIGYGVEIPLGKDSGLPNRIEIDLANTSLEKEDETTVTFPEPNVMRIRGGESGIIRTLFYLLEEFGGVRYLFQGEMDGIGFGTHFPKIESLGIPRKNITHTSAFPLTRSSGQTTYGAHWQPGANRRYFWRWEARLGAKERVPRDHDLPKIAFPIDEYRKGEKQPPGEEAFPIQYGKRVLPWKQETGKANWQPNYSSPEAVDEAVKNLLEFLRKHPNTTGLSLAVNDCGGHSETEKDHLVDAYYHWVNAVVERVTKEFPKVMFGVIAYREVEAPPSFKLHPNVVSYLTFDFHSTMDPQVRARREKLIRDWSQVAKVGSYSYNTGDTAYTLPRIYFREMQNVIRYLHAHGGVAAYTERSYTVASEGPKMYLFYKLLENPDLDMEATIQDWCQAAVGPEAAPSLRKYYAFWEDFWRTKAIRTAWWNSRQAVYLSLPPFGSYMYALEKGDMAKCRELMGKTVALADTHGTGDQKKRAHFLMSTFEWYEANATACGAEIFSPDGKLADRAAALELIRNIPNAEKAFEKSISLPLKTEGWLAPKVTTESLARADVVVGSLSSVSSYLSDKEVADELGKLSVNSKVSPQIRFLAGVLLKSSSGNQEGNRVDDGSFESGDQGWTVSAVHGTLARSDEVAFEGRHSLKCGIDHTNYTITKQVPNAKPHTDYYFSARVYVPKDQPVAEGRLNIFGQGTYWVGKKIHMRGATTNITDIGLRSGEWNYVSAIIPGQALTDSLRLSIKFKGFERGNVAYVDDVQVYEVPKEEAIAPKKDGE